MSMSDLGYVAMASLMPEITAEMERSIVSADWHAIEQGAIGLGFNVEMRGCSVEVDCYLRRGGDREQLFFVSRTLAPAARA